MVSRSISSIINLVRLIHPSVRTIYLMILYCFRESCQIKQKRMKQMCLFLIKKSFLWKLFDVDFILVYTSSSYAGNRHALEYKRILRNRLSVYENLDWYKFVPVWYKIVPVWYNFIPDWYKFVPGWYWLILEFGCFNLTQNSGPNFGTWMWKNFFNLSFRDWVIGLYPRMIDLVWYKFIPVWYKIIPDWYNFIPDWYKFVPD